METDNKYIRNYELAFFSSKEYFAVFHWPETISVNEVAEFPHCKQIARPFFPALKKKHVD